MEGIRFEWDEGKNLSNRCKHGVSFEEASQVFRDPLYVSVQDRVEGGELRWQALGLVKHLLLLTELTPAEVRLTSESPQKKKQILRFAQDDKLIFEFTLH